MNSISILDGLILTVVSMAVVFFVLAAIWGLVELTARLIKEDEIPIDPATSVRNIPVNADQSGSLAANKAHQQTAELISLVLASEDQPDKKFEIVESIRIK